MIHTFKDFLLHPQNYSYKVLTSVKNCPFSVISATIIGVTAAPTGPSQDWSPIVPNAFQIRNT